MNVEEALAVLDRATQADATREDLLSASSWLSENLGKADGEGSARQYRAAVARIVVTVDDSAALRLTGDLSLLLPESAPELRAIALSNAAPAVREYAKELLDDFLRDETRLPIEIKRA